MALKTNETATLFSQKKLLGKAHTSNLNLDVNESIGSTIQSSAGLLFGETIPNTPTLTLNTVQDNTVEYVEFALEVIPGSTYDANDSGGGAGSDSGESSQVSGPHAYAFKFKSTYETDTDNTKAGDGNFDNNKILHETLGAVQIIPPFYSRELVNPYIIKIYKDDGAGGIGDEIPLLDDIDWQVDTYNGVLFVQDYDALKIPAFARAFIYVGKMLSETVEDAAGSGGSGLAAREKYDYEVTSTYLSGSEFFVPSTDFSEADYDPTLIDVYRNGQLILSGTDAEVGSGDADYFVNSATSIKIGFDLFADDTISVATYGTATTINREKYDYEVTSITLSGSAFNVSNSDLASSSYDPTLIDVFHNGQLLLSGTNSEVGAGDADYFISAATQLKFGIDLVEDDILSVVTYVNNSISSAAASSEATYLVVSADADLENERIITAGTGLQSSDAGAGGAFTIKVEKELVFNEVLGGNADGSNTYFTFANTPFATTDVSVFVNGQLQVPNDKTDYQDYSVTGSHMYFTTGSTPELGSLVMAIYNKVVS